MQTKTIGVAPEVAPDKAEDAFVEVESLTKAFGSPAGGDDFIALQDVTFTVDRGEFITVIGPSGCGKSTLLDCIAGLTKATSGHVSVDGRRVDGPGPDRVVVFQSASLLPWRTVTGNVTYGAELARWDKGRIQAGGKEAIRLVGLSGFEAHFPRQLSGGMQQRVNLARALMMDAEVILMDEPFGALDAMTKRAMQDELLSLQAKLMKTIIFITHDLDEAVYLGDRVLIMGTKPGGLREIRQVPFARPRARALIDTPEFRAITKYISGSLS